MGLLAINTDTSEIRYYYGDNFFDVPHDIETGNIFIFKKPPVRREFMVKDGRPIENIAYIPSFFSIDNVDTTKNNSEFYTTSSGDDGIYFMDQ